MTSIVVESFRLIRQDVARYGSDDAVEDILADFVFEQLAHKLRPIDAMTTRNFYDIRELLDGGTRVIPSPTDQERVVGRGLANTGPFHRPRNSVADARRIEASTLPDKPVWIISRSYPMFQCDGLELKGCDRPAGVGS
jgi:hypothetical protein